MPFPRRLVLTLILLLGACAPTGFVAPPHEGGLLLKVPFFPQPEGLCGPASLASVLNYWQEKGSQEKTSLDEIRRAVFLPQLNGTLGLDLTRFARNKGWAAHSFKGTLSDLRDRLAQGMPLIAFLNLGNRFFPVGHFIVVTGINEGREEVIAHSGSEANKAIPYRTFMAAWSRTDFWTLQVLPSGDG